MLKFCWRHIRHSRAGLALLLLGVVCSVGYSQSAALVEYVDGDVWIERSGVRTDAFFGDELSASDRIGTGADGVAVVLLNDESTIKLRADTSVVIGSVARPTRVDLERGGVFARFARQAGAGQAGTAFRVHTRTVVAGVRGTEFFVAFGRTIEDEADVWLCVNEGEVEVSVPRTGDSTVVREGEGINILAGTRVTDPQFYDWTTKLNWGFDAEAGEVRDTTDLDAAYSDLLDQDYD